MGKLFRLKDYVLLGAAFVGEISEEVRLVGGLIPSMMKGRYGFIPSKYKKTSYLTEVSEMLTSGEIKREYDESGNYYLVLTSVGKKKLKRRFNLTRKYKKWDGYFMTVIFDIPEKEKKTRDSLRRKLGELGFGMLQKSVWINPYHFEEDLKEFLELHGLGSDIFVLSAKNIWSGNIKSLAEKVWRLKEIDKEYKSVIKKLKNFSKKPKDKQRKILENAYEIYLNTLAFDPLLPGELLPSYWSRRKALKCLNKNKKILKNK